MLLINWKPNILTDYEKWDTKYIVYIFIGNKSIQCFSMAKSSISTACSCWSSVLEHASNAVQYIVDVAGLLSLELLPDVLERSIIRSCGCSGPPLEVTCLDQAPCLHKLGVGPFQKQVECWVKLDTLVVAAVPSLQIVIRPQQQTVLAPRRRRVNCGLNPRVLQVFHVLVNLVVLWEGPCSTPDALKRIQDQVLGKVPHRLGPRVDLAEVLALGFLLGSYRLQTEGLPLQLQAFCEVKSTPVESGIRETDLQCLPRGGLKVQHEGLWATW